MTVKAKDVAEAHKRMQEALAERNTLAAVWAGQNCPYSIGQEIEIRGYSHEGKRGRVTRINGTVDRHGDADWRVFVDVLKADGSTGKLKADWSGHTEKMRTRWR